MELKPGVKLLGVTGPAIVSVMAAGWLWAEMFPDLPFVWTSSRDGKHGRGSKHWCGSGVDIRTRRLKPDKDRVVAYVTELRRRLGGKLSEYDVVAEWTPWHVHVEWDPKTG